MPAITLPSTRAALAPALPVPNGVEPLFPADMPVAYDAAGHVVSRYGDHTWDLSGMSTDGTSAQTLHFFCPDTLQASPLDLLIREQQKALMWLHMDAGKTRSWASLLSSNLALKAWGDNASKRNVDLYALLSNPEWVAEGSKELNKTYLDCTPAVLRTLWRHRIDLGAPADIQLLALRQVLSTEAKSRPETQQTPLIPSRVYCAVVGALDDRIALIEREVDLLLEAYELSLTASRDATPSLTRTQPTTYPAKTLAGVVERLKTLGYEPRKRASLDQSIASRLGEHQMTLMLTVAAYTGMRVGEVSILPLEGVLETFEHLGTDHFEIHGATTKLNQGIKRQTTWITSHQGARAVGLAQKIGRAVGRIHARAPKAGQVALLFPVLSNPYKKIAETVRDACLSRLRQIVCPVIEQSDIEELDRLELARGWTRDDILVGQRWPLAFHQLRRSLAVYAHRSGMVSLPALKAQLQHITQEMTLYYSGGFSRAVNLVFDKKHFSHEWEASKAESSYFAYAFAVLFSDEDLLGQGAQRMAKTVESRSRHDTLRLFQQNKLAYCETPLGGCVSTEACKTDPLEPIPYDCLESNCVNLVVFRKRLDHVIKLQKLAVATLKKDEDGSVEHRLEARHLEVLLKANHRLAAGAR